MNTNKPYPHFSEMKGNHEYKAVENPVMYQIHGGDRQPSRFPGFAERPEWSEDNLCFSYEIFEDLLEVAEMVHELQLFLLAVSVGTECPVPLIQCSEELLKEADEIVERWTPDSGEEA